MWVGPSLQNYIQINYIYLSTTSSFNSTSLLCKANKILLAFCPACEIFFDNNVLKKHNTILEQKNIFAKNDQLKFNLHSYLEKKSKANRERYNLFDF